MQNRTKCSGAARSVFLSHEYIIHPLPCRGKNQTNEPFFQDILL